MFVHEDIYDTFIAKFKENASKIRVAHAFDEEVLHGPVVDKIQFDRILGYIQKGKEDGAKIEVGGNQVGNQGFFIEPTLFTGVTDAMTIAKEEIFGPVVCAMKFKTVEEVIERANDTPYGLAAAIHTKDIRLATRVMNSLDAGTVWINCYNVFLDQVPFGGYKQSGIGRELGEYALREYSQIKTVISAIAEGL